MSQTEPNPVLKAIPPGWIAKPEAVRLSQRSLKRFEHAATQAGFKTQLVSNPGTRPIRIYRQSDVESIAKGAKSPQTVPNRTVPDRTGGTSLVPRSLVSVLEGLLNRTGDAVPLAQKPRVTLREAVALGFPASELKACVKSGMLENVGSAHRFRFRRRDLDAL